MCILKAKFEIQVTFWLRVSIRCSLAFRYNKFLLYALNILKTLLQVIIGYFVLSNVRIRKIVFCTATWSNFKYLLVAWSITLSWWWILWKECFVSIPQFFLISLFYQCLSLLFFTLQMGWAHLGLCWCVVTHEVTKDSVIVLPLFCKTECVTTHQHTSSATPKTQSTDP